MSRLPLEERFAQQFERRGDDECWPWKNCKSALGYGRFFMDGKSRIAPRVAFELFKGPIGDGLCILHSCDNPSCVNPAHLREGTLKDNSADQVRRGRFKGQKITPAIADLIRSEISQKRTFHRDIAARYGVSRSRITVIASQIKHEARNV